MLWSSRFYCKVISSIIITTSVKVINVHEEHEGFSLYVFYLREFRVLQRHFRDAAVGVAGIFHGTLSGVRGLEKIAGQSRVGAVALPAPRQEPVVFDRVAAVDEAGRAGDCRDRDDRVFCFFSR